MEQLKLLDSRTSGSHSNDTRRLGARLPNRIVRGARRTFLEFFAGSGLVAEGLKGIFLPVWANDNCSKKAAVYIANHGHKHFQSCSIAEVGGASLPCAELAWASFPCQDLSLAGRSGGINGARSGLVWEWLRVIDEMPKRPSILVAENVLGLVSAAGGDNYRTLHRALIDRGYMVGAMMLDATRWLPQSRPRVFVVAVARSVEIPEELIGVEPGWIHPKAVCRVADRLDGWTWWRMPEPPKRESRLLDVIEWKAHFPDVETEQRNIKLISRRHRKQLDALPGDVVLPGYKRTRDGKQVLELRFDDVAGCLRTPDGGSSRQVLVMRKRQRIRSRLLTMREAARLMGAPERYKIPGSYNDGYKAMGDAVAVPVARWLARKLLLPLAIAADGR